MPQTAGGEDGWTCVGATPWAGGGKRKPATDCTPSPTGMDDEDDAQQHQQLLRLLSTAQRDQLLLCALRRDAALLEQAREAAAAAAAAAPAQPPPPIDQPTTSSTGAVSFADLPAPALELIAGHVYASFCCPGCLAPPVSDVLAATRALRATCQAWRRSIDTARTVVALDFGPRSGRFWWDPTHGATVRRVRVQPVPPRVYPTAGPAAGMALPQGRAAEDSAPDKMQLECRVVRRDASGEVRLEVCGSWRAQEPAGASHPQVEVCDTGGGGGTVWVRGRVDLSRGEIPWHSCVPYLLCTLHM